ncbi:MAG: hypothetical protein MMC33_008287 [Icmadophila ericetorum]|nr:hypothetical protein [Icmadophila ericetorum]
MGEATGSLKTLGEFEDTVQAKTPVWNRVLHRASHPDKKSDGETAHKKHTLILSILCNNMHRILSDNLPTLLSIYMASGGCRGRVIDLFNSLGLCKSSKPTHAITKKLSEQGRDKVHETGSNPKAIVTYDNFKFTGGRRGDRIGDKRSFRSITTCLTLVGQGMPECGLKQRMWKPLTLLLPTEMIAKMRRDDHCQQMRLFFIEAAIKESTVRKSGRDLSTRWLIQPPEVQPFPMERTVYYPIAPVMKDENTNENNLAILEEIHIKQFGMDETHSRFNDELRIVYGDLKTVNRMLSIKAAREETSKALYDKLSWVQPGTGLLHLRMNYCQAIHTVHWGGSFPLDPSTLQYAADRLDRSNVVKVTNFRGLEELIMHSYHSRVMTMLMECMKADKVDLVSEDARNDWIMVHSSSAWKSRLMSIYNRIHPDPDANREGSVDEIWLNHIRFCQNVEP